ncbi:MULTISPECIES: hypothetical protein [unclassified Streptomyces]|uniref:hypothetical protein n=1 Tax=Streptomyces sp. NPDC055082 TaxID=3365718 RepID=UPI0037D762F0
MDDGATQDSAYLAGLLRKLYDEARRSHPTISYDSLKRTLGIPVSTIGDWLKGTSTPGDQAKYLQLVEYLEGKRGQPLVHRDVWLKAIAAAQAKSRRNRGGRPRKGPRARPVTPFRYVHIAREWLPADFAGRDAELDRLADTLRTKSANPGYLTLQAPPWAGKTAFLAAFVLHRVPEDTDLIAYFVRRGTTAQHSEDFAPVMVRQLDLLIGKKENRGGGYEAVLPALYEEAAKACVVRGRRLLLVVDGLDEDTGAGFGKDSIAALLPRQLLTGLTVLVGRRWYPPLPSVLPGSHPLRRAEQLPGFRPSPRAVVVRDMALEDLTELLKDTQGPGRETLGFLTLAGRGGLGYEDLAELIETGGRVPAPIPGDLEERLRNVTGRGVGPDDLAPDTFALAHAELLKTAESTLGRRCLAALTRRLDAWADDYRARDWPEETPAYLLQHYPQSLRDRGDLGRFIDFALDHRRLLRLADLGRTDLALVSLAQVTEATSASADLASAAASRSLLDRERKLVPREVLRALAAVGDLARARSLALSPADPASRAVRLIEVARTLSVLEAAPAEEHRALAREAAKWAREAQCQSSVTTLAAEPDTEAVVPRAAVALASAKLSEEAVQLLGTVDTCRPEHVAAAAEAAALLLGSHPAFAGDVLDDLSLEAEYQAESTDGRPVFAVEIWAAVAAADPERADPVHQRIKEFAGGLDVTSGGPAAVDCFALAASALAHTLPDTAGEFAVRALHGLRLLQNAAPQGAVRETSSRVARALLDTGETRERVRTLLGASAEGADEEVESSAGAGESDELLKEASRLSDLGDGPALRQCVDRFLNRAAERADPVAWLPHLGERALEVAGPQDAPLVVHASASAALTHSRERRTALLHAENAAEAARRVTGPELPAVRSLVAQAFAHAGAAEQARKWAAPADGRRMFGRNGAEYRRAALAVETILCPQSAVARDRTGVEDDDFQAGVLRVLVDHTAGAPVEASLAALKNPASARRASEPGMAAALALLHAALGDTEQARETIADVADPEAEGAALATVAAHLAGVPVLLDVDAEEHDWTPAVVGSLVYGLCPRQPVNTGLVRDMVHKALRTSAWYRTLPVLAEIEPEAVRAVVGVLEQNRRTGV